MLFHILAPMHFMECWVFELKNRGKKNVIARGVAGRIG